MSEKRTVGRLQLILIGLVFVGPLVVSFIVYFGGLWSPESSSVNGELLATPVQLPDEPFSEEIQASRFRDKWSLIHLISGSCDDQCQEALYETRQVRQALNRDRDRVQRVLCSVASGPEDAFFTKEHPRLSRVAKDFPACALLAGIANDIAHGEIFLADPLGNVIIRYPANSGMRGMHRDLKRLLRVSRIG